MWPFLNRNGPCGKDKSCVFKVLLSLDLKARAISAQRECFPPCLLAGTPLRSLTVRRKPGVFSAGTHSPQARRPALYMPARGETASFVRNQFLAEVILQAPPLPHDLRGLVNIYRPSVYEWVMACPDSLRWFLERFMIFLAVAPQKVARHAFYCREKPTPKPFNPACDLGAPLYAIQ